MNDSEKKGVVMIVLGIAAGYFGWPVLAVILVVFGCLALL